MAIANSHDRDLSAAFDAQAAQFEVAPVQSNPHDLARLVQFADLPADSLVLDAGCGPGLVARAFLEAGHRVIGVDLSAEMIGRARKRCAEFGERVTFIQGSVFDALPHGPTFDAAVSRYVLHHIAQPYAFIAQQVKLLRRSGTLILCDHTTDPDPERAAWHRQIEIARDRTHQTNLTPGQIVDLLIRAGLGDIRAQEQAFTLDFDEWFDRGSPCEPKEQVRHRILAGPGARGFEAIEQSNGSITISCWRSMIRGIKK